MLADGDGERAREWTRVQVPEFATSCSARESMFDRKAVYRRLVWRTSIEFSRAQDLKD